MTEAFIERLLEDNPQFVPVPPAEALVGPNPVVPEPPVEVDPIDATYLVSETASGHLLVVNPWNVSLGTYETMAEVNTRIAQDQAEQLGREGWEVLNNYVEGPRVTEQTPAVYEAPNQTLPPVPNPMAISPDVAGPVPSGTPLPGGGVQP